MMRTTCVALAALLLIGVAGVMASGQGPETTRLILTGKYGSVTVPHWEHQESLTDCKPCHALFPKERGAVARLKAENVLKKKEVMNTCRNCHLSLTKAGKESGPTKCYECHAAE